MELYGDVFKLGTGFLTKAGEHRDSHEFNGNPILLGSFDEKIRREMVFEDTFEEQLRRFQEQADWAILNGLTYWERQRWAAPEQAVRLRVRLRHRQAEAGAEEALQLPLPRVLRVKLSLYPTTWS